MRNRFQFGQHLTRQRGMSVFQKWQENRDFDQPWSRPRRVQHSKNTQILAPVFSLEKPIFLGFLHALIDLPKGLAVSNCLHSTSNGTLVAIGESQFAIQSLTYICL